MTLKPKNFYAAVTMTILFACVIFIFSYTKGKEEFFLLLNHDLGNAGDWFFFIFTKLGEGWWWILIAAWLTWKKKKQLLLYTFFCFALSTLFIQGGKHLVFPGEKRPYNAIKNKDRIHTVSMEKPHSFNSFPSGHSATGFTFYLFLSLIFGGWWLIAGLVAALLIGYSRVYLAQHFPVDVAGGMICAALAATISYAIVRKYFAKLQ